MNNLPHVLDVEPLGDHRIRLTFDDGLVGDVDLADELWGPVFELLRDPTMFVRVRVDPDLGTVSWPNGADLDPCTLHDAVVAARRPA